MGKYNFFDSGERPPLRVGRRIIKTALAVFICGFICWLRGDASPIFSMIAAIMCIQPTRDQSVTNAFNRTIGTGVGGALGALILFLGHLLDFISIVPLYYFVISAMLIPLIQITLIIRKPTVSAFACVVFLSVTVTRTTDQSPIQFAAERTLETLIGIAVGLIVNLIIPKSKRVRELEKAKETESLPPPPNEEEGLGIAEMIGESVEGNSKTKK